MKLIACGSEPRRALRLSGQPPRRLIGRVNA
jgi:hypothetical protein